jgi:hypothetical protein
VRQCLFFRPVGPESEAPPSFSRGYLISSVKIHAPIFSLYLPAPWTGLQIQTNRPCLNQTFLRETGLQKTQNPYNVPKVNLIWLYACKFGSFYPNLSVNRDPSDLNPFR